MCAAVGRFQNNRECIYGVERLERRAGDCWSTTWRNTEAWGRTRLGTPGNTQAGPRKSLASTMESASLQSSSSVCSSLFAACLPMTNGKLKLLLLSPVVCLTMRTGPAIAISRLPSFFITCSWKRPCEVVCEFFHRASIIPGLIHWQHMQAYN